MATSSQHFSAVNGRWGRSWLYFAMISLLLLPSVGRAAETNQNSTLAYRQLEDKTGDDSQGLPACLDVKFAKDKCQFVKDHCASERIGYIDYLMGYYCPRSSIGAYIFLVGTIIWLICLFMTIGIAASDFVCPNLNTMASSMGLSESLIGVTFLAFGNGSPDVFSTYAAMKIGSGSLAIGELIGAASFIVAVVSGAMALVRPFKVSRKSFIRDVTFFAVAIIFTMWFMSDGLLQLWECVIMLVFYISYVIFVVWWHWYWARKRKNYLADVRARNFYTSPLDEHTTNSEDLEPYNDSQSSVGTSNNNRQRDDEEGEEEEENDAVDSGPLLSHTPDFHALTRSNNDDPESNRNQPLKDEDEEEEEEGEAYEEITRHMSLHHQHRENNNNNNVYDEENLDIENEDGVGVVSPPLTPNHDTHRRSRSHRHQRSRSRDSATAGKTATIRPSLFGALEFRSLIQKLEDSKQAKGSDSSIPLTTNFRDNENYGNIEQSNDENNEQSNGNEQPRSHRDLPHLVITSDNNNELEEDMGNSYTNRFSPDSPSDTRRSSSTIDRMSPLPSNNSRQVWRFQLPQLPFYFSTSTFCKLVPTLNGLTHKPWYGIITSILTAPSVFFLTLTVPVYETKTQKELSRDEEFSSLSKEERLNDEKGQVSRWLLILQALFAPISLGLMALIGKVSIWWILLGSSITSLIFLLLVNIAYPPSRDLPKTYIKHISFVGFLIAISWVSTIANEVVAVLKMLGTVYHISDAVLGLTVFAMGNSLGDLVSNMTIAKMGYPMMALSACFGGPMLNIMVGVGVSCLVVMLQQRKSDEAYRIELSPTLGISGITLLLTLLLLLVAVPLNKWEMSRTIGFITIMFWTVSTIINVFIEISYH